MNHMDLTIVDLAHDPSPCSDLEKESRHDQSNEINDLLFGTKITSITNREIDSTKKPFSFHFSFNSFRAVSTVAVTTMKSLYSRLLLSRKSAKKHYWDIIIELILGYNVITTLYFLAYAMPGSAMSVLDFICWIIFIFDIVFTFFTEGETEKGELTRSFRIISTNYLKSWFFLDVFAIIPLSAGGAPRIEYYFRMVRLLKLPGVLDITDGTGLSYLLTYFNIGRKEKDGSVSYSMKVKIITSFIQIFITLIFFVYFFGCLWFWFQKTVANYKYSESELEGDDHVFQDDYSLTGLSSEHVAIRSSYFMLTTMATIGYGDFLPRNVYEMAFISIVMLFGVTLFAVIMANFNSAIAFYAESSGKGDQLGDLNCWLDSIEKSKGKLNKHLRKKIIDFFTYYSRADKLKGLAKNHWEASDDIEEITAITQEYVKDLPETNYYHILKGLFKRFLGDFRWYFTKSHFRFDIIPYLQPMKFEKGACLIKNNENLEFVIFVVAGSFTAGFDLNNEYCLVNYFKDGRTVIGDYPALTGKPTQFDYFAESIVETLVINSELFMKILNNKYKEDRSKILTIAVEREIRFKRIMHENRRFAGLHQQLSDDKRTTVLKDFQVKSNLQFSEEQIQKSLKEIEKNHNEVNLKSSKVLRNLSLMDSLRTSSISKISEILSS